MNGLLKCPKCGWWGTRGDLDFEDGTLLSGLFKGLAACPDCDLLEAHLEPYQPEAE